MKRAQSLSTEHQVPREYIQCLLYNLWYNKPWLSFISALPMLIIVTIEDQFLVCTRRPERGDGKQSSDDVTKGDEGEQAAGSPAKRRHGNA